MAIFSGMDISATGMTAQQIAAEKAMIDMEVREILRSEFLYC